MGVAPTRRPARPHVGQDMEYLCRSTSHAKPSSQPAQTRDTQRAPQPLEPSQQGSQSHNYVLMYCVHTRAHVKVMGVQGHSFMDPHDDGYGLALRRLRLYDHRRQAAATPSAALSVKPPSSFCPPSRPTPHRSPEVTQQVSVRLPSLAIATRTSAPPSSQSSKQARRHRSQTAFGRRSTGPFPPSSPSDPSRYAPSARPNTAPLTAPSAQLVASSTFCPDTESRV